MNNSLNDREILNLLHPEIQLAIQKKWRNNTGFLDIQKEAIPAIISGENCLIISPTAGGKTEAAFLPVLSNIYESALEKEKIQVIIIAPLKALLNDLEIRLRDWLNYVTDITIFKWHGDVSAYSKNKQRKEPASFLLTTPESLDVMLASQSIDQNDYFSDVKSIIIDEAHYFAKDSRGAQLASALERVQKYAGQTIQRIGLSATVGDPTTVSSWLSGSGAETILIKAGGRHRNVEISHIFIDEHEDDYMDRLESTLSKLTEKGKTIIFSNSKKEVESTARMLGKNGRKVMVHHGSVSKLLREEFEESMREDPDDAVISATSTLELGIDIGDLQQVIQRDNLPSVNSFLQRIGRAGRKSGKAFISLISSSMENFVLNIAMSTLGLRDGYNEPLRPSRKRYDILLQQLLMEILRNSGICADSFFKKVGKTYSFRDISQRDFGDLIRYWVDKEFLQFVDSTLIIGPVFEKKYGGRNYMELYSVFDVNENYTVYFNEEEIGLLEGWFALRLKPDESVFLLAGRKWLVEDIVSEFKIIKVKPAKDALPPTWRGGSYFSVELEVARRYKEIVEGTYDLNKIITPEALKILDQYRKKLSSTPIPEGYIGISKINKKILIETYAGSMINSIISFILEDAFPESKIYCDYLRLEMASHKLDQINIVNSLNEFFANIMTMDYEKWIHFLSSHLTDFQYSRFSIYIPTHYSVHHAASSYFVLDEVKRFIDDLKKENHFLVNNNL
jgi:ATP-dependent helicase Lhr and Lhr-like helicase